ncbi:MAG TPA: LamG-like jellyroll fold domain-containing protein [Friedmanniella sp.]
MSVDTATPRLWTWRRLVGVTLAKSLLVGLLGLAAWGALPAAIGWHPTTVSSGSMLPRLHVGDIAVSRPLGSHIPPLTSVLLFHDPDHPGRLRMHRFVRIDDAGLLVTRGDANPEDDSTPISLGAVVGIGTLRVPWIALPIVWLRTGQWLYLALVALGLGLGLAVAASSRDHGFGDEDPPDDARSEEGAPDETPPERHGTGPGRSLSGFLPRATALLCAGLLAAGLAAPAQAAFSGTAKTTGSIAATTYFSCANAITALGPYLWYRMDETSSTTTSAADSSGGARTGVYSSAGKTSVTTKACARDTGRAMTFNGSTGYLSSPLINAALPNTFSLAIWFRTTTKTGGKLIGFGNSQTGASSAFDRHVYMTNAGKLVFGVYPGTVKTVTSSVAYNDGDWHLVVATLSTAGMRLYLDGDLDVSDPSVTTAESVSSGYLRVGYDNIDGWVSVPTSRFFAGTLDDAVALPTALTAAQVSALYEAGTT